MDAINNKNNKTCCLICGLDEWNVVSNLDSDNLDLILKVFNVKLHCDKSTKICSKCCFHLNVLLDELNTNITNSKTTTDKDRETGCKMYLVEVDKKYREYIYNIYTEDKRLEYENFYKTLTKPPSNLQVKLPVKLDEKLFQCRVRMTFDKTGKKQKAFCQQAQQKVSTEPQRASSRNSNNLDEFKIVFNESNVVVPRSILFSGADRISSPIGGSKKSVSFSNNDTIVLADSTHMEISSESDDDSEEYILPTTRRIKVDNKIKFDKEKAKGVAANLPNKKRAKAKNTNTALINKFGNKYFSSFIKLTIIANMSERLSQEIIDSAEEGSAKKPIVQSNDIFCPTVSSTPAVAKMSIELSSSDFSDDSTNDNNVDLMTFDQLKSSGEILTAKKLTKHKKKQLPINVFSSSSDEETLQTPNKENTLLSSPDLRNGTAISKRNSIKKRKLFSPDIQKMNSNSKKQKRSLSLSSDDSNKDPKGTVSINLDENSTDTEIQFAKKQSTEKKQNLSDTDDEDNITTKTVEKNRSPEHYDEESVGKKDKNTTAKTQNDSENESTSSDDSSDDPVSLLKTNGNEKKSIDKKVTKLDEGLNGKSSSNVNTGNLTNSNEYSSDDSDDIPLSNSANYDNSVNFPSASFDLLKATKIPDDNDANVNFLNRSKATQNKDDELKENIKESNDDEKDYLFDDVICMQTKASRKEIQSADELIDSYTKQLKSKADENKSRLDNVNCMDLLNDLLSSDQQATNIVGGTAAAAAAINNSTTSTSSLLTEIEGIQLDLLNDLETSIAY